jgi:hypothetical protein
LDRVAASDAFLPRSSSTTRVKSQATDTRQHPTQHGECDSEQDGSAGFQGKGLVGIELGSVKFKQVTLSILDPG